MNKQPYLDRRGILMERLQKGLIFVPGRSAGGVNPDFLYLTGLAEPRGALLLAPGGTRIGTGRLYPGPDYVRGRMAQQVLFLPPSDPLASQWGEEAAATLDSVTAEEAGVDAVIGCGEMNAVFSQSLAAASLLFHVRGAAPSLDGDDDADARFVARLRRRFIGLEVRDGSRDVHEMRRLKDAGEVEAIEKAVAVTAEALDRVLGMLRPGMQESWV